MAKVRSLDHTRFVITCTGLSKSARTFYFGGNEYGNEKPQMGVWCNDLGGAEVFTDLHEARKVMEACYTHYIEQLKYGNTEQGLSFDIKLVQKKDVMVARLKYNPEEING